MTDYRGGVQLLSCEVIGEICADLIAGMKLLPPPPPYPGAEDEVPACHWVATHGHDYAWTAYVLAGANPPMEAEHSGATSGTSPFRSVSVATDHYEVGTAGIDRVAMERIYDGDTPDYLVMETDRLSAIGAIAVQPQNMPHTFVHLPRVRVSVLADTYDVTLEGATRVAEFLVAHRIEP